MSVVGAREGPWGRRGLSQREAIETTFMTSSWLLSRNRYLPRCRLLSNIV